MADLVNVGIAGRVYVRFKPDDAADTQALGMFRRAGARLDRERVLWFVGTHQRQAALAAVVVTGGDLTGLKEPDEWKTAADGGLPLVSGWVLTAAGPRGIWYANPFSATPDAAVILSWQEAADALSSAPESHRGALLELVNAAEALAGRRPSRQPFTDLVELHGDLTDIASDLERLGGRFRLDAMVWVVPSANAEAARKLIQHRSNRPGDYPTATPEQLGELDRLLLALSKYGQRGEMEAAGIRGKIDRAGGWVKLTTWTAAKLLEDGTDTLNSLRGWV